MQDNLKGWRAGGKSATPAILAQEVAALKISHPPATSTEGDGQLRLLKSKGIDEQLQVCVTNRLAPCGLTTRFAKVAVGGWLEYHDVKLS